jgi:hypothetical protein
MSETIEPVIVPAPADGATECQRIWKRCTSANREGTTRERERAGHRKR